MMATLGDILKRVRALDVSEAEKQKQVDKLLGPVRELERIQAEKADALAAQKAIEREIAQLEAENDEDTGWLDAVTAEEDTLNQAVAGLAALERLIERGGPVGQTITFDVYQANRLWGQVRSVMQEQVPARRARVAQKQSRINELRGQQ